MCVHVNVFVCMFQILDDYQCAVEEQKQSVAMEKETESKTVKKLVKFFNIHDTSVIYVQ